MELFTKNNSMKFYVVGGCLSNCCLYIKLTMSCLFAFETVLTSFKNIFGWG